MALEDVVSKWYDQHDGSWGGREGEAGEALDEGG
jgi:hypothetical protein